MAHEYSLSHLKNTLTVCRIVVVAQVVVFWFALFPVASYSSASLLPVAARSELLKLCPLLKDDGEVAIGDINDDGIDDIATIIHCAEGGKQRHRVDVLTGVRDGRFAISQQSVSWEPSMRRMENIEVKRRSVLIGASSTSYTEYWGTTYQFSNRGGTFVLIGLESFNGKIGDDGGNGRSANFLTKKMIDWTDEKSGRKNLHRTIKGDFKMPLRKFDLESAFDSGSIQ